MKPRIAITLGDPAGIGPEIVSKALRDPRVKRACQTIVLGNTNRIRMGRASREAGRRAIDALKEGLGLVRAGRAQALVTAPVSKESFRLADHGFPGHTEWLAARCHAPEAAMLMVSGPLRAILLTRHLPLKDVSRHLNSRMIQRSAELGYQFVKDVLGKPRPRIIACGVNPHAGDHGIIGTEEETIYGPAIRALKKKRVLVLGPLPSDSVFPKMAKGQYDLALAAYHDQGMIPLKLYAPEPIVNIT